MLHLRPGTFLSRKYDTGLAQLIGLKWLYTFMKLSTKILKNDCHHWLFSTPAGYLEGPSSNPAPAQGTVIRNVCCFPRSHQAYVEIVP